MGTIDGGRGCAMPFPRFPWRKAGAIPRRLDNF